MGEPIILSTGMASLGEVEAALAVLKAAGAPMNSITLLHCTTEYPAPVTEVNLRAMHTMGAAFNLPFGYSDHTEGLAIPFAATALGACVIEKHFTLDRGMDGPDHKASLEPDELATMVSGIRAIESALGDGVKRPTESELRNIVVARKSIVAARKIAVGERFSVENLTVKRPGHGISPMEWDQVLGRYSPRVFSEDEAIQL
jgi:sialic acid synthase SpsE